VVDELLHLAPCGILEFADDGKIQFANATLAGLLQYSDDELRGLKFDEVLTVSSRIFHQTHFMPLLRLHGRADEIFFTLRKRSEEKLPVLANAVRVRREGGWRIICVFMPALQRGRYEEEILAAKRKAEDALQSNDELQRSRSELEERLEELDREHCDVERKRAELSRLSEIVSHDLQEPVRKISVFADLVRSESAQVLSEIAKMGLDRIDAASARIDELLEALGEFLLVDRQAEELQKVELGSVVELARRRAGTRIPVEVGASPSVEGYAEQLTTLFTGLLRNTLDRHLENAPRVRIAATIVQHNSFQRIAGKYRYIDFVQIIYSDDSGGYGREDCDPIFQLLWRGGSEQKPDPRLAICRKIAENHHGSITLRSPTEVGATFVILLPQRQGRREG